MSEPEKLRQYQSISYNFKLHIRVCASTHVCAHVCRLVGRALARRHNKCFIELKLSAPLGHIGLLMPLEQQGKAGVVLGRVIDLDFHWESRLLLHNGGKEYYI